MKRVGEGLDALLARMAGGHPPAADALRRAQVLSLWEEAVRAVFKDAADLVLDHTNAVYIMSGEQGAAVRRFDRPASEAAAAQPACGNVLVVYADDSMVRSELDNRQELMKMKLRERGEDVEAFRIMPSTRDMRHRHPFRRPEGAAPPRAGAPSPVSSPSRPRCADSRGGSRSSRPPLSSREEAALREASSRVDDAALARAFEKAMAASRESQNGGTGEK